MDQTTSEYMRMLRLSLRDALQGPLEETSWIFPNFEARVIDNVRMGLFLHPDRKRPRREHLLEINLAEVATMEAMLANDFKDELKSRMFSPKIDAKALSSRVTLDFDFDYKTMTVNVKEASDESLNTVPSLENWRFVPTLPPVFVVFGFTPHYSEVEDWQWAYVEPYEKWVQSLERPLRHRHYSDMQIGGWADFRQDGDYDTYIAQVNTEHGDAGAIYLEYADGEFCGFEQMC
jgi:hypothetical protein